ncbi:Acyl-COA oxydase [Chondrus crispus]|uniref:Acyl-coenzyme A oxidase n=1 Tax=Chondrus crispus TaxID=2769 RepID=R7Q711_CHOCR|nr:acyl-CoA oxidase [Chondrus crispus]XP_005712969.1 Acyl-COA oxydase [Chondrus crispus]CDF33165.1 acyl-CoA oxidase [Chondrus crispus]CDF33166.1 Acyl-COA oxydase [Chondrus crispus]|eukprot:XP_005712968.1 acyl-CoA oxidase [Chondrus crispus]
MNISDATFQRLEAEFNAPSVRSSTSPLLNRQWISDAEAQQRAGVNPFPPGVVAPRPVFDIKKMRELLDMNNFALRDSFYELFKNPVFFPRYNESLAEQRARTIQRWRLIAKTGVFHNTLQTFTAEGRQRYEATLESVGAMEHSMEIKMGVHYGLFGGTVSLMGDDEQCAKWTPKIENCQMLGCFAMTELGHGSNVKGIQTKAVYDIPSQTFIVNTPCEEAQKYWIGGAFQSARWTALFAQLYVKGVCHGVHPFLVRIRNEDGTTVPGVTIGDCGAKNGLNGVDNGRMWFSNVRVPHDHLLRRHSQVSRDGTFTSNFKSADERFGASLASLSGGRVSVSAGSLVQAKLALSIAIRYGLSRKAFGPPGQEETRLMDYPAYQARLIPPLATTFVMQLVLNHLKAKWQRGELGRELHVWSSGFKALISWHSLQTLQETREACGGQGYKSENRIGPMKTSHDVALTYEGDNHVLLQAVTKTVFSEFMKGVRSGGNFKGHFAYLKDAEGLRQADLSGMDARSAAFALTVMRRREAALFARLAADLQKRTATGVSSLQAFNDCAVLVEDAGRAHVELLMVELFHHTLGDLQRGGETEVADMLRLCGALHTARTVDEQVVFLRCGAVSVGEAQMMHANVGRFCETLRPHVLSLVESFGYPPHLLAPIAFDYVAHNSKSRL